MNQKKHWVHYSSFVFGLITALCSFLLALRFFEETRLEPAALYNAGVDVLGIFVCMVLFASCVWQPDSASPVFIGLILMTNLAFFNNEWIWYVSKVPEYRTWMLFLVSMADLLDVVLIFHFYGYVRERMQVSGKLVRWMDRAAAVLIVPFLALLVYNAFVPVCFIVDETGAFQMLPLHWLTDLYLWILAPMTVGVILFSKATGKQKWVTLSFILIPLVHIVVTMDGFAYATQYGSILIALIVIYCVMSNERTRKLSATATELQTASEIQDGMLPHTFPPFPDRTEFELFASMDPAWEVGGDFYDFFLIDEDHLCLVIADVSGKGVPAALFMMISKLIVQNFARYGQSVAETLTRTNEMLFANNQVKMFVTVWLGILEISTGKLTAGNAGHEYPMIRRAGGFYELFKDKHDFVIGGMPDMRYRDYELQLRPGDTLFVYTDGVPEAANAAKEMFGTDRMLETLNRQPDAGPEETIAGMRRAVDGFVKKAEQFDDMTMLCLLYKGTEKRGLDHEGTDAGSEC